MDHKVLGDAVEGWARRSHQAQRFQLYFWEMGDHRGILDLGASHMMTGRNSIQQGPHGDTETCEKAALRVLVGVGRAWTVSRAKGQ